MPNLNPSSMAILQRRCAAEIEIRRRGLRKPVWSPYPNSPQEQAYRCLADEIYFGGGAGGGKMLDVKTPVPTPSGWTTVGEVRAGDMVFAETGKPICVLQTHQVDPHPESYRLTFDDGTTIDACADHRWLTFNAAELTALSRRDPAFRAWRRDNRPIRRTGSRSLVFSEALALKNATHPPPCMPAPTGTVRTTRQIVGTLKTKTGRTNHAIPVTEAFDLPEAVLPIPPYTLGVWLGNGSSYGQGLTCPDAETIGEIERDGFQVVKWAGKYAYGIKGIKVKLRLLDLLVNKHIPPVYLRSSSAQRLSLLQGLMDTDGTVCGSGSVEFTTTSQALAEGMHELIVSMGWKARIVEGRATLYGKDCGPKYDIKWTPSKYVFRLPRKRNRQRLATRRTTRFRYITGCERIPAVPMRCLTVDNPTGLFLVGKSMVPTHNTDLALGLAVTAHRRSLVLRRESTQLRGIIERARDLLGNRGRFNENTGVWRLADRVIEMAGCKEEGDKRKFQGRPHDLIVFDEAPEFSESQVQFISGWLRTENTGQRCRVVLTGNPPTTSDGRWIVRRYARWLDRRRYPDPVPPGELRWYAMVDGQEVEVPDGTPFSHGRETIRPKSRTFIRALVQDNPAYMATGYADQLASLPEPLRSQMLKGDFDIEAKDDPWQIVPTAWLDAAVSRWRPDGGQGQPLSSLGVDVARGGDDWTVIVARRGTWFAHPDKHAGVTTTDGARVAALIVERMERGAVVNVDVIGVGAAVEDALRANGIRYQPVNVAAGTEYTDRQGRLRFSNVRAAAWWHLREMLDPASPDSLAIPPHPELIEDLTAQRWELGIRGMKVEDKDDVRRRLGRSPDCGDALVLALWGIGRTAVPTVVTRRPLETAGMLRGY